MAATTHHQLNQPQDVFTFPQKSLGGSKTPLHRCDRQQNHSSLNVLKVGKVSEVGQGDSNFSSRQQIVENFKLEAPASDGQWAGCMHHFATNK